MTKRVKSIFAVLVLVALATGGWRLFRHESNLVPAIVTPQMDVHNEFSGDFSARLYRT